MKLALEMNYYPATTSFQLTWPNHVTAHGTSLAEVFFNFVSAMRGDIMHALIAPGQPEPSHVGERIIEPSNCDGVIVTKISLPGAIHYQIETADEEDRWVHLSGSQVVAMVLELIHHLNSGMFKEYDPQLDTPKIAIDPIH